MSLLSCPRDPPQVISVSDAVSHALNIPHAQRELAPLFQRLVASILQALKVLYEDSTRAILFAYEEQGPDSVWGVQDAAGDTGDSDSLF